MDEALAEQPLSFADQTNQTTLEAGPSAELEMRRSRNNSTRWNTAVIENFVVIENDQTFDDTSPLARPCHPDIVNDVDQSFKNYQGETFEVNFSNGA